jgi:hypothetical protein
MPVGSTNTSGIAGPFLPNGATVTFPFDFKAPSASEVTTELQRPGLAPVALGGFTVEINPPSGPDGGSITFAVPPAAGSTLYILLSPRFDQPIGFANGAPWRAEPVNEAADRSTLRDQALRRDVARSLKTPLGVAAPAMQSPAGQAGKFPVLLPDGSLGWSSGTGADAALRGDMANAAIGAALLAFQLGVPGATPTDVAKHLGRRAYLEDMGVSAITSASYNVTKFQAMMDAGVKQINLPPYPIVLNGQVQYKINGQSVRGVEGCSELVKSADTVGRLLYAEGLSDISLLHVKMDGVRSQSANFVDEKWLVFFRTCVRPKVQHCRMYESLTDALVFELCTDPVSQSNDCSNNNKGGIYWSSCDGGKSLADCCDNNGASASGIGNGFLVACTWRLTITAPMAKNNIQGQIISSRGTRDLLVIGGQLGDRQQTRGAFSFYAIGETINGTIHGQVYASPTLYGTSNTRFIGTKMFLPPVGSFCDGVSFSDCEIENIGSSVPHGALFFGGTRIGFKDGFVKTANGAGVGIALASGDGGVTHPTAVLVDGVDFDVASGNRLFDYGGGAGWVERYSSVAGVPVGRAAIADLPISVTSGTLPVANNLVVIADAAAPTNLELLEAFIELNAKVAAILNRGRARGELAP